MRKLIVVCLLVGFLYSCSGPAKDSDAGSSNDSGGSSERDTPAAQPSDTQEANDTVASAPPLEVTSASPSDGAYDMPYLDDRYEEGTNGDLKEDTEMYALIDSEEEGTPFLIEIDGFETFVFNARTPYYADLDDLAVNEYGHVGSGSILVINGHEDGEPIYIEFHSFAGTSEYDHCEGYECRAVISWDGPD